MKKNSVLKRFLHSNKLITVLLLVAIIIFYTIMTKGAFLKVRNITNILNAMSVNAFFAIGAACLMISGQMDMSAGACGTMSAIMVSNLLEKTELPLLVIILCSVAAGAVVGMLNATLIHKFRFQGFIATLATASILESIGYSFNNAVALRIEDPVLVFIGTARIANLIPVSVILIVILFIVYGIILSKTSFGRKVYLIGGNPQAVRLTGIKPVKISYALFINSSILGGFAGILHASRIKSASMQGTSTSQFAGMTAAILGGVSFGGGSGGLGGGFLGLLLLNTFNNGISSIGLSSYWQTVASGGLLIIALTLDQFANVRNKKLKS